MKLKAKPAVKSKEVDNRMLMVKTEPEVITKPNIEPNKERKQDVKPNVKITYEEEKVALLLGTTAVFTVWWMFK